MSARLENSSQEEGRHALLHCSPAFLVPVYADADREAAACRCGRCVERVAVDNSERVLSVCGRLLGRLCISVRCLGSSSSGRASSCAVEQAALPCCSVDGSVGLVAATLGSLGVDSLDVDLEGRWHSSADHCFAIELCQVGGSRRGWGSCQYGNSSDGIWLAGRAQDWLLSLTRFWGTRLQARV